MSSNLKSRPSTPTISSPRQIGAEAVMQSLPVTLEV